MCENIMCSLLVDWKTDKWYPSAFLLCAEMICLSLFMLRLNPSSYILQLHFNGSHESRKIWFWHWWPPLPPLPPFTHLIMHYDFRSLAAWISFLGWLFVHIVLCGTVCDTVRWSGRWAIIVFSLFLWIVIVVGACMSNGCAEPTELTLIKDTRTYLCSLINVVFINCNHQLLYFSPSRFQ